MKLTNLYNYEGGQSFHINSYTNLANTPAISNVINNEDWLEKFLEPGIYDSAKENRAYLRLTEQLGLADLSSENLVEVTLQTQIKDEPVIQISFNTSAQRQMKFTIKINYIFRRINSYWQSNIDKSLVLFKRIFAGQSYGKIALDFGVKVSTLKSLITDFRKLWQLYKAHLIYKNNLRKLTSQHFEFIKSFLI